VPEVLQRVMIRSFRSEQRILRTADREVVVKRITDAKFRKMADELGDWIAKDAMIHIPLNAAVERDELGAWVECKVLVPWPQETATD